jgi:hypothetical protein
MINNVCIPLFINFIYYGNNLIYPVFPIAQVQLHVPAQVLPEFSDVNPSTFLYKRRSGSWDIAPVASVKVKLPLYLTK